MLICILYKELYEIIIRRATLNNLRVGSRLRFEKDTCSSNPDPHIISIPKHASPHTPMPYVHRLPVQSPFKTAGKMEAPNSLDLQAPEALNSDLAAPCKLEKQA